MTDTAATSEAIETHVVRVDPRKLKLLEKNARFMRAAVFKRLVANIKRDGVLTQLPLVYRGTVLSGNHRTKASIEAGLAEIDVLELLSTVSPERARAIALSHNAISGEDDPSILAECLAELSFDERLYSGVTDDMLEVAPLDISALASGPVQYQEIVITFLREDAEDFVSFLERFGSKASKLKLVAHTDDFDQLFDTLIRVKAKKNIFNTALALRALTDLAIERLNQLESEDA